MRIVIASWTRAALALPLLLLLIVLLAGAWWLGRGVGSSAPEGALDAAGSSADLGAPTQEQGRAARNVAASETLARAVISTGQITLVPDSIGRARSEVVSMVVGWSGSVADEETSSDERGRVVESTLTLRVPSAKFAQAMDGIARTGTVQHQSRAAEDVTTRVIDNAARVRAAERSIQQIERLLDRAEKLSDIISIESDLARRQADLDSLKAQQAWLEDQTSLSTISVFLHLADDAATTADDRGFVAGLVRGWHALGTALVVALTALGTVLPFAVLLALVGGPAWLLLRRRRSAPTPVAGEA